MAAAARISVNIHELVSKNITLVSKKGKNTSQTGKQFGKYFHCFCLAEALLAEAEVEKTPLLTGRGHSNLLLQKVGKNCDELFFHNIGI